MRHTAAILLLAALPGCATPNRPNDLQDAQSDYVANQRMAANPGRPSSEVAELSGRVWQKDWQGWYDLCRSSGYNNAESQYQANRMMGPSGSCGSSRPAPLGRCRS